MAEFQAARRLLELIAAGRVPPEMLERAAAGQLTLPPEDRVALLAHLAASPGPWRELAATSLRRLEPARVATVLARPDCPRPPAAAPAAASTSLDASAPPAPPSSEEPVLDDAARALLAEAEAGGAGEAFQLVEASAEETAALAAAAPNAGAPPPNPTENLFIRLANMTVPERTRRALLGGREERLLLARDANRVVQRAVVNSPRLTENDVEQIACMRNVSADVLRALGASRRWRQSMGVVKNLVNNPRTPVEVGLQLAKHLFTNDLRLLAANKNVNDTLRRMASRLLVQRIS